MCSNQVPQAGVRAAEEPAHHSMACYPIGSERNSDYSLVTNSVSLSRTPQAMPSSET
jgi:hypothetical protein